MYKFGKVKVFLISGKAGVGKSTFAGLMLNHIKKITENAGIINFAAAVKRVAYGEFNWNGEKDEKGRKLLQNIGQFGREYYEDLWVDKVIDFIYSRLPNVVVIDDWRYPNEYTKIKESGIADIVRIRITAPDREKIDKNSDAYTHPSETSLDNYEFDYYIDNNDLSIDDLDELARLIVLENIQ